jgi:hypothetical protein
LRWLHQTIGNTIPGGAQPGRLVSSTDEGVGRTALRSESALDLRDITAKNMTAMTLAASGGSLAPIASRIVRMAAKKPTCARRIQSWIRETRAQIYA